jgi:hypothetical protein
MSSAPTDAVVGIRQKSLVERWFFPGMAVLMIAVAVAGFAPSIVDPARRLAPLSPLVAVHGILFLSWLILFFLQTMLIATRHVSLHRSMGIVAIVLLCVLVPLSYEVTVQMVRRGYDLSGDQMTRTDPFFGSIFNFFAVIEFPLLARAALAYRCRKEVHKRLMLFANLMLMVPAITHFFGHIGWLSPLTILGSLALLMLSAVVGDYLAAGRIHPLTVTLAVLLFLFQPIQAIVGGTTAWHHFAAWLVR